jgi:hypothetical protein
VVDVESRLEPVPLLAGVVGGHEVLLAILGPLHRAPDQACQVRHQEVLRVELAPHAEAAPRVGLFHADPAQGHIQQLREHPAVEVGHLGRPPDDEAITARIVVGNEAPGLQGHPGVATYLDVDLDDVRRGVERRLDVPVAHL